MKISLETSSITLKTTGSADRQEEVGEVLHYSLMHYGTVSMLFNTIYLEPTTQLKDGIEDSAN